MLDSNRLVIFLSAAETLNFSETARQLHISQANVSHHIKALEKELGARLFDRSGSKTALTDAGRLLLPRARKLIKESIEIKDMVSSLSEEIAGEIRIACSTTAGKYILPIYASRFREQHPMVHIRILRCAPGTVSDQLQEDDADLGVVSHEVCGGPLECQEFFHDHIILIAPPDHPFTERKAVEPEDLIGQPVIAREPDSGVRRLLVSELGKRDISLDDLEIVLEIGNAEAIIRSVAAGFGIGFVSRIAADCALRNGTVVHIPLKGMHLLRRAFIVRRTLQNANRAVEAFWSYIHSPANEDLLQSTRA